MAWFKSQMNARSEPTHFGQRPIISDADGKKYSISGYSESHSSERYEAKTEQTFQFRGALGMTDYEHSSPRKDMHNKEQFGMDGKPLLVPWGLGREHYKSHSPTGRDHEYGKYNTYFKNKEEYESDDDDHERVENTKEGFNKQSFIKDEDYDHTLKYQGNGQTRPRKQTYYGKSNSFDDLDLEKEKNKSHAPIYNPPNKYTAPCPSLNYPKQETHYEKAPTYYNEPKKQETHYEKVPTYYNGLKKQETRYEKAPTYYNEKHKEKDNEDYTPPYTVPTTIIPKKEVYNRPMVMQNPPPIRTRIDRGKDAEYYSEGKNSPHYNSPRKDHQGFGEIVDNRRYGKVAPREVVYVAEDYTGVIDSREAARRYKGVLITS